jgi:hypothetical protein
MNLNVNNSKKLFVYMNKSKKKKIKNLNKQEK